MSTVNWAGSWINPQRRNFLIMNTAFNFANQKDLKRKSNLEFYPMMLLWNINFF